VLSRNLENEEAKTRYRAVENTSTMGCNARKTNKQTNVDYMVPITRDGEILMNRGFVFGKRRSSNWGN
jgi:cytochrome oxidase assembly protein ShyY1